MYQESDRARISMIRSLRLKLFFLESRKAHEETISLVRKAIKTIQLSDDIKNAVSTFNDIMIVTDRYIVENMS
jgi:hypothetical protein